MVKRHADATVVICAYTFERWQDLIAAVDSVCLGSITPRQILVVIDRNDELLARAARELSNVEVIANQHSGGNCGARNTGIDHADGEIVVFVDDDVIVDQDWLEWILAPYTDPDVLGVGGRVVPLWRFDRPSWFPTEFNWVIGCSYPGMPLKLGPVRNPIGANLSVRRAVLLALGGFDESMGRVVNREQVSGTCDETELCIRASQRWPGRRWLYEPAACVHHVVPRSRTSWAFFVDRCRIEGHAKAQLTHLAGSDDSLRSERAYVSSVLPRAVLHECARMLRGDLGSLGRAGAIIVGVGVTAGAYLRLRVSVALARFPGVVFTRSSR